MLRVATLNRAEASIQNRRDNTFAKPRTTHVDIPQPPYASRHASLIAMQSFFNTPVLPSLPASVYMAGVVAFVVAAVLVLTKRWHGQFSMDPMVGVQKTHLSPTPRIGGVAIVVGVCFGYLFASVERQAILGVVVLAGLPAFAFGLVEDVTKTVSVQARLLATMASGVLGWWLTGVALTAVDVPFIDPLLSYGVMSVLFTAFAVGGVANAVNIVDGFNGLASGFVVIALVGVACIAVGVGDTDLALSTLVISAAVIGFWLINWPWGKLFLGDGGSYFCGFALAWSCVLLIERNAEVTAFAPLLICVHPVTEVIFSIYRRRVRKVSPGHADRLHLHSLLMRRALKPMLRKLFPNEPGLVQRMRNPVTGLVLALMTLPAVLLAYWTHESTLLSALVFVGFALGYLTVYARLVRFHWCSPFAFVLNTLPRRVQG